MNPLIWIYGGVHHDSGMRQRLLEELSKQQIAPHFVAVEWGEVFEKFVLWRRWVEERLRPRWDFLTSQDCRELSLALAWESNAHEECSQALKCCGWKLVFRRRNSNPMAQSFRKASQAVCSNDSVTPVALPWVPMPIPHQSRSQRRNLSGVEKSMAAQMVSSSGFRSTFNRARPPLRSI